MNMILILEYYAIKKQIRINAKNNNNSNKIGIKGPVFRILVKIKQY